MKRQEMLLKGGEAYERLKMVRELVLLPVFFFSYTTPSYKKAWFKRMSEAIISRRGYGPEGKPRLITETIVTNQSWTVPNDIKGNLSVRIFGGGSGAYHNGGLRMWGGGGGWMNNGEISITSGSQISITIGAGGNGGQYQTSGGTTSFGTYLSANGGSGSSGGSGAGCWTESGGRGYQFGGGGTTDMGSGSGGAGGMWGGGGGAAGGTPGRGGTYGGGGGSIWIWYDSVSPPGGIGGTYGGNGGNQTLPAENGTNTIGLEGVPENCQGAGLGGGWYGGGGGYGGNGGAGCTNYGGGGGGYGGNGGSGIVGDGLSWGGGGGGGY